MNRSDCKLCQVMLKKYPNDPLTKEGLLKHGTCGLCKYDCGCKQCIEDSNRMARHFLAALGMDPNQVK